LSEWKLEELQALAKLHHPEVICLTKTWLNADKQRTTHIDGYSTLFSHRANRISGAVCILGVIELVSESCSVSHIDYTLITVGKTEH